MIGTFEIDVFDKIIELTLNDQSAPYDHDFTDDISDDINEAISIMLTGDDDDELVHEEPECSTTQNNLRLLSDVRITDTLPASPMLSQASTTKCLLKGMQPYRERPSKDRRKRFCVSGDSSVPDSHDVCTYQFWAITPQNKMIAKAKCFVLGQIVSLFHLGVLCDSGKNQIYRNINSSHPGAI